jgi:hypothetical protein
VDRGFGPGDRGVCGPVDLLIDSCIRIHALLLLLRSVPALVAEITMYFDTFILDSFVPFWRDIDSTFCTHFDSVVYRLRLDDVLVESRRFSQQCE